MLNHKQSYKEQLGMNPSTASGRLVKDLLFSFIQKEKIPCFRCKKPLTRDTFSIEHKIPWRNNKDAVSLFFDLENITYSHLQCNISAARSTSKSINHGTLNAYQNKGCRCDLCKEEASRRSKRKPYCPKKRRQQYLKHGQ